MEDHAMSFDWILYAILVPPVLLAIFELMRTWKPSSQGIYQGGNADKRFKGAKRG